MFYGYHFFSRILSVLELLMFYVNHMFIDRIQFLVNLFMCQKMAFEKYEKATEINFAIPRYEKIDTN